MLQCSLERSGRLVQERFFLPCSLKCDENISMAYLPLHVREFDVCLCVSASSIRCELLKLITMPRCLLAPTDLPFKICESIPDRGVKKFPIWADSSTTTPASSSLMFAFSLIVSFIYARYGHGVMPFQTSNSWYVLKPKLKDTFSRHFTHTHMQINTHQKRG